jgi:hypothetical protein
MSTPLQALYAASRGILVANKAMADLLIANSKEVAAMREVLKKRDAQFEKLYEYEKKEADSTSQLVPVVARLQDTLDEMLQSLADIQRLLPEI